MKLLRYGSKGREKPGFLDEGGRIRDLSEVIEDITPALLAPEQLAELAAIIEAREHPIVTGTLRIGVPVNGIGKFLGIGLNYSDHAGEVSDTPRKEPVIFTKAISCLNGPNDEIMLPREPQCPDWEAELAVVIGRKARYVEDVEALSYVAGYVVVNDITDRGFQNASGQWDKGKGCDTFGPIGPWLVTPDEVDDPQNLNLWLELNGCRMQNGNTRNMIFTVAELIANVSRYITLEPGDILTTGTPIGVGSSYRPPIYLKPGDVMRLGVEGLGVQEQRVTAFE